MGVFMRRHALGNKVSHWNSKRRTGTWASLLGTLFAFSLVYRYIGIEEFNTRTYGRRVQENDHDTTVVMGEIEEGDRPLKGTTHIENMTSEDIESDKFGPHNNVAVKIIPDTKESSDPPVDVNKTLKVDPTTTSDIGEDVEENDALSIATEHMAWLLWNKSMSHEFVENCKPHAFTMTSPEINDMPELLQVFTSESERSLDRNNIKRIDTKVLIDGVPCTKINDTPCCKNTFWFRFGSTDVHVFNQVIQQHYLKLLYPFARGNLAGEMQYILDAGGNCGLSTYIIKALFPKAMVITLEPDPENFKILQKNTQQLKNVHRINAGLWNETTKIKLSGNHGDWGRIFKKVPDSDEEGMLAYSVQDLLKKFDIPRFDLIKMDIEGSESVVLSSYSNISWLQNVKVLFMEIHDFFADYFGLSKENNEVTQIVQDAVRKHPELVMFADNEHTVYIQKNFVDQVLVM